MIGRRWSGSPCLRLSLPTPPLCAQNPQGHQLTQGQDVEVVGELHRQEPQIQAAGQVVACRLGQRQPLTLDPDQTIADLPEEENRQGRGAPFQPLPKPDLLDRKDRREVEGQVVGDEAQTDPTLNTTIALSDQVGAVEPRVEWLV